MHGRFLLLGLLLVLGVGTSRAEVLAALAVPATQERAFSFHAKGVQIYECRAAPGAPGKYEWAFQAPEAELFDVKGERAGRHYAGPTWEMSGVGIFVGKLKAKVDAPDGKGIPWLLLDVTQKSGSDAMGKVLSIQRVDTVGGQPPAEPADAAHAGQVRRVDYTATYIFYVAKP